MITVGALFCTHWMRLTESTQRGVYDESPLLPSDVSVVVREGHRMPPSPSRHIRRYPSPSWGFADMAHPTDAERDTSYADETKSLQPCGLCIELGEEEPDHDGADCI